MIPNIMNPLGVEEHWPLTFQALEDSTVKMIIVGGSPTVSGLKYRKKFQQWTSYTIDDTISLKAGQWVQFKNQADALNTDGNTSRFSLTGKITVFGDLMSMLNYPSCKGYCFCNLFTGTYGLYSAQHIELPTKLQHHCLQSLFSSCYDLQYGPLILPAKTLASACYGYMFNWAQKLRRMPKIPDDCVLGGGYEFVGTFAGCGNRLTGYLQTVPFPFTVLKTRTFMQTFDGTRRVNRIEVNFTSWNQENYGTLNWIDSNFPASGTFIKPKDLPTEFGRSKIPPGWKVIDK